MTDAEKLQAVEAALDGACKECAQLALGYGRSCDVLECPSCGSLFLACACPVGADEQGI